MLVCMPSTFADESDCFGGFCAKIWSTFVDKDSRFTGLTDFQRLYQEQVCCYGVCGCVGGGLCAEMLMMVMLRVVMVMVVQVDVFLEAHLRSYFGGMVDFISKAETGSALAQPHLGRTRRANDIRRNHSHTHAYACVHR